MSDYLAPLPVDQVAAWYRRLAATIGSRTVADTGAGGQTVQREPLAAIFLRHYLDNRQPGSTFTFTAPNYLRQASQVRLVLAYHRAVFLTEQQARIGQSLRWVGVLLRIRGSGGHPVWSLTTPLQMEYESLVEIGSGLMDIARIQTSGTDQERDLFTALRGFQLHSRVRVVGQRLRNGHVSIRFQSWQSSVHDTYDFDFSEHLTVPNPDYGSTDRGAVRPQDQTLTVYHRNAQRLEQAHLAAPYVIRSDEWPVSDAHLLRAGEVDPSRRI